MKIYLTVQSDLAFRIVPKRHEAKKRKSTLDHLSIEKTL